MSKLLVTAALATLLSSSAAIAGASGGGPSPPPSSAGGNFTFLLGLAAEFGDTSSTPDVGVTGKVLYAPMGNGLVVGGGGTFFPWSTQKFGLDLSAGLGFNGLAALGGYDFLTQKLQLSGGFTPTFTCPVGETLVSGQCQSKNLNQSDRRRKRDVVHVATLSDGVKLYAFRYLDSDTRYVGVMAQDLLDDPRFGHAVLTDSEGFYLVDYDQLDLVMATFEDWTAYGLDAVVLGERPREFWTEQAA